MKNYRQITDMETIFAKAKDIFKNVQKCTMTENQICGIDIYRNCEDYYYHPRYQITPNWAQTNKFNIVICYSVSGWSNCVEILSDITISDVFLFFECMQRGGLT